MALDAVVVWNLADIASAIILLAALVLMAKFYHEYLEVDISELRNWRFITIGFALYVAVKTHFTVTANILGDGMIRGSEVAEYPSSVVLLLGGVLVAASVLVFIGFYGLIADYL